MNYGKKFENNFKKGVGKELVRLYDTTNGYAGVKTPVILFTINTLSSTYLN